MDAKTIRLPGEGHDTVYFRGGSGPALLWLHHLAGMDGWEAVHERLSSRFDVIAPYQPGFGTTDGAALDEFDTGLDLVLHYGQLLDALGAGPVHVAGHSIGGWLAAELAAIQPGRVQRMALVSPVGLWDESIGGEDPYAQMPMAATTVLLADPESRGKLILKDGAVNMLENYVQEMKDLKGSAKYLWPLPDTGVQKRLHLVKAPTLIVSCGMDRVVPTLYGEAWQQRIAGAQRVTIPDAGHLVNLEQPERLADVVGNFLAGGE
jgi:pimeloyl-ACP methyl ester carboxylesterase